MSRRDLGELCWNSIEDVVIVRMIGFGAQLDRLHGEHNIREGKALF